MATRIAPSRSADFFFFFFSPPVSGVSSAAFFSSGTSVCVALSGVESSEPVVSVTSLA